MFIASEYATESESLLPSSDMVQLEQDTVMGVESLLLLCSQDDSPSAQATLKVSDFLLFP